MNNLNIYLPNLGLDEVEVSEILVKENDLINIDKILLLVESNKTTIEISSDKNGIINKIFIKVGDILKSGDKLFEITTKDNKNKEKSLEKLYDVIIKYKNDTEEKINKIFVKINDYIKFNDKLIETESGYIILSNFEGSIKNIFINKDNKLLNNEKIFNINYNNILNKTDIDHNNNIIYINLHKINDKKFIKSSPSIRRLLKEHNIKNLSDIKIENNEKLLHEDVYKYLINNINNKEKIEKNNLNKNFIFNEEKYDYNFNEFGSIEELELKGVNKISSERMYYNWINIPHVTQFDNIDITETENFRKYQNKLNENNNLEKISLLSFVIKSIHKSLIKFNILNSSLSKDKKFIILKKYINIGIAIDTDYGLFVPVIKNICKKSLIEISNEIKNLSIKAKNKKLLKDDINGGTFTISSLGSIGDCNFFTPIINHPEVAILGISKFNIIPKWNGEKFIPKLILPISLSYDHRVMNGAYVVRFVNYFKNLLEDCRKLLI